MKLNIIRHKPLAGFTLMELLIVLAILIIIMAILVPNVMTAVTKARTRSARAWIKIFDDKLRLYHDDTGTYPTPEQGGLNALLFRPTLNNMSQPMGGPASPMPNQNPQQPQPGPQDYNMPPGPNQNPTTPSPFPPQQYAPQGQFGNNGVPQPAGFGNGITQNPMQNPMQNPTQNPPNFGAGNNNPGFGNSGGVPGTPGTFGNGGAPATWGDTGTPSSFGNNNLGMTGNMYDNNNSNNDAIRMANAIKKWEGPYFDDRSEIPMDPWGNPYNYEYPTNRTPDGKPAIWSNGPDGKNDNGEGDDITNYDLAATMAFREQEARIKQERLQDSQQQYGQNPYGQQNQYGQQNPYGTSTDGMPMNNQNIPPGGMPMNNQNIPPGGMPMNNQNIPPGGMPMNNQNTPNTRPQPLPSGF